MDKKIMAIVLALACIVAMCLPAYAAKPTGDGDYVSGSSDSDVESSVEELMEGFSYVFTGVYNEEEGYEILLAFDTEYSYGFVGITQPSTNTLVWALLGEWASEDGVETFSNEDQDYPFTFVIEEETDDSMTISLPEDGNGQITLDAAELSDMEDFLTTMMTGGFTGDGSSDSSYSSGDSDVDSAVAEMLEGFDAVYYGDYNTSEGYKILLAFDSTNQYGVVGITQPSTNTLVWAVLGEWTTSSDGVESFSNEEYDYPFNFVIQESTTSKLVITLPDDGNGQLTLSAASLSDLEEFLTKFVSGDFAE